MSFLRRLFSRSSKVSYCMRTHRVEKFLDDFELLHEQLDSELIILPTFPEGGELSSLFGEGMDEQWGGYLFTGSLTNMISLATNENNRGWVQTDTDNYRT